MSIERYLPERIAKSPETLEYYQVTGAVLEGLMEQKDELFAQFTIDTATWGLTLWEQEYGLPTDLSKPHDYRRSRLRARMRGQGTTTVGMLENMAESFINGDVEVSEKSGQYIVVIRFVGKYGVPPNIEDLMAALQEIKPAHVMLEYQYTYVTFDQLDAQNLTFDQLDAKNLTFDEFEKGEWLDA